MLPPLAAELDQYVFQDTQLEGLSKDLFSKSGEADIGLASVSSCPEEMNGSHTFSLSRQ